MPMNVALCRTCVKGIIPIYEAGRAFENRTAQLFLELYLLRLRYSPHEFAELEDLLKKTDSDRELAHITELVARLHLPEEKKERRPRSKNRRANIRGSLLSLVRGAEGLADFRRIETIARRLGIESLSSEPERAAVQVEERMSILSDDDLNSRFSRLKLDHEPDEGFLDLANFLLEKK